ncbi:OTU domain-containing protein 4 [Galendromus occidentalis]|uniref:OTU domain-containing protein 4 n=1 Tax=Galendromus occidentalis TaxID=34638 RepID=A0AAJ6QJN3_9ACAR|nr:OTU domain-containing protein 4 [Galendromus occidentalis]
MSHMKRRSIAALPSHLSSLISSSSSQAWSGGSSVAQEMSDDFSEAAMDEFFENRGLFRYHLPVDGTCLFRAVSEALFGCQTKHQAIRETFLKYMETNQKQLSKDFDRNQSADEQVQSMRDIQYPSVMSEMHILSKIYKVDFLVYFLPEPNPKNVTRGSHEKKIVLCWSHSKQYDLVYTRQHIEALRVTQAIVYDVLYKDVFELGSDEVDFAVNQMLYEKDNFKNKRHLTFTQWCNSVTEGEEKDVPQLPENKGEQIVLAVRCGVPPFPFKVAKCLDPRILRNVEYLNWCEEKRDAFRSGNLITPALDSGVKCTARIGMKEHTGFVQSIDRKADSAEVFLQSIGAVRTIPLCQIESSPVKKDQRCGRDEDDIGKIKPFTSTPMKSRRSLSTGDAITKDQSKALSERFNVSRTNRERTLRQIPEMSDYEYNSYDEVHQKGKKHGRKGSLPAAHLSPITSSPPTTYVQSSPPIAMISTPMPPVIVDVSGRYHVGVSSPTDAPLYSPPSHFVRSNSEPYPVSVPVVPLTEFNPSVPPPTLHSMPNEIDPPDEVVEFGFSFPGPPGSFDAPSVGKIERNDGADLPRMDVLRYFFNLGVSVYRMRKSAENSIVDDSLLQSSTPNNSYSITTPISGYSIVPQHSVVYQPSYPHFYSLVPSQQQAPYAEVPTYQVGSIMATKPMS